jgi:hypothetical protein
MVVARRSRLHVMTMRSGNALAVLLGLLGLTSACHDPRSELADTDVAETSEGADASDTDTPDRDSEGCVSIDRIHVGTVAPAGVQVHFRVLGCDGEALPRIAADRHRGHRSRQRPTLRGRGQLRLGPGRAGEHGAIHRARARHVELDLRLGRGR